MKQIKIWKWKRSEEKFSTLLANWFIVIMVITSFLHLLIIFIIPNLRKDYKDHHQQKKSCINQIPIMNICPLREPTRNKRQQEHDATEMAHNFSIIAPFIFKRINISFIFLFSFSYPERKKRKQQTNNRNQDVTYKSHSNYFFVLLIILIRLINFNMIKKVREQVIL